MKKLLVFLACMSVCGLTGCASSNDEKIANLESRVSYLEKQLGVSSANDADSKSITELQKVLDSYQWSPNFKDTNYKYGCYETSDLKQLNRISQFYGNDTDQIDWSIYGVKGNNIIFGHKSNISDKPNSYCVYKDTTSTFMSVSYSQLNSTVDVNNIFNTCNTVTDNTYADDNLLFTVDIRDLYDEYSMYSTQQSKELEPFAKYTFINIIYKDNNKLFHEYIAFDSNTYEEIKPFLTDTTKSVGIKDIDTIYTNLINNYTELDSNSQDTSSGEDLARRAINEVNSQLNSAF